MAALSTRFSPHGAGNCCSLVSLNSGIGCLAGSEPAYAVSRPATDKHRWAEMSGPPSVKGADVLRPISEGAAGLRQGGRTPASSRPFCDGRTSGGVRRERINHVHPVARTHFPLAKPGSVACPDRLRSSESSHAKDQEVRCETFQALRPGKADAPHAWFPPSALREDEQAENVALRRTSWSRRAMRLRSNAVSRSASEARSTLTSPGG